MFKFLSGFPSLSEEERRAIASAITVRTFKKGSILLEADEVADECFFVLKGCIRQYYVIDGEEKTTAFFTENQAVVSFASYMERLPSKHYLSCVEDTTLIVGNFRQEEEMYRQFPKLVVITRTIMEQDYGKTQAAFASFITSSPEKRYLDLLANRP